MGCRLAWCVVGFGSQSYADVVRDRVTTDPRGAVLLVVGDFDCSGEDIERDRVERTGCCSPTSRCARTSSRRPRASAATRGWPAFARRYGFDIERPVQW